MVTIEIIADIYDMFTTEELGTEEIRVLDEREKGKTRLLRHVVPVDPRLR